MYKFIKFSSFAILIILTACCCYMLLFHIGVFPAICSIDNNVQVNETLLNLSYSYLAGLVFYLINDGVPSLIKMMRANRHIGKYLCEIQSQLNYISSLCCFIKKQKFDNVKVLYVGVSSKKYLKRVVEQKQIKTDIDIDHTIANVVYNLQTIESMLVSCYLSSDTALLLSEIRSCINSIERERNIISRNQMIDKLTNISIKIDNHFWFPKKHTFRTLTAAEASTIENKKRI